MPVHDLIVDVAAVELFATTLVHPDRSRIVIPNRKIIGEILHNYGTTRQLDLAVTVPHGADLGLLLPLAGEVARANARVLKDPAPVVGISQVGDSGIRPSVRPWVRVHDYVTTQAELYETLLARFAAIGAGAPTPHHAVRLVNGAPLR